MTNEPETPTSTMNPPCLRTVAAATPSLTQSNHDMLTSIRTRLDDQEVKIQEQLHRFQGIKKYVEGGREEGSPRRGADRISVPSPSSQGH